jgi:hypothetical protein
MRVVSIARTMKQPTSRRAASSGPVKPAYLRSTDGD